MAFSLITSVSAGGSDGGNSVTTVGVDTTGADFLVACVSRYSGGGAAPLTDSKSNTWTPLTDRIVGTAAGCRLYYCASPTVGSGHTFSASGTGVYPSVAALAFSGANVASVFGAESAGGGGDGQTSVQPGSLTPSEDNALWVTGVISYNGNVQSIDGGFTAQELVANVGGQHVSLGLAFLIQTSAAAANPTWSIDPGTPSAVTAAGAWFKAAAGGGPTYLAGNVSVMSRRVRHRVRPGGGRG